MSQPRTNQADRLFLLLASILVVFGLIMLASASAPIGYTKFGDTYFFVKKQILLGLIPGTIMFLIFAKLNYEFWRKLSYVFYFATILVLILVWVPGLGVVINGSRSWINIFGLSFQPSELAKLGVVLILARLLSECKDLGDWKAGLLPIFAILSPVVLLIAIQDVGTLSIIVMIIFSLLYIAGARKTHLFLLGLTGILAFAALLIAAPYRVNRLTTFLHPELDPKGLGYQINQAYLAIGSGGFWGLGLGHSRQKFQYLPEVQSDSVFAIISEEMGFIISASLVLLITFLGLRGLKIAKAAPDEFSRLLVSGIMIWFIWQSFLNISAIIGLLPLTGVPLPFVSQGGSALFVSLVAIGIVMSISKTSKV